MISEVEARERVSRVPHWHHKLAVFPNVVTPGSYDPGFLWEKLQLPSDLKGTRVLDVGASDGFYTLHLARSGADVTAVDYRKKEEHGFQVMQALNGISVDYRVMSVYDLDPNLVGKFDIILFLGVLYHLPHLIKALHILRKCCKGKMYLKSHSDNESPAHVPSARYYRYDTLAGDYTNFWSPNRLCIIDMQFDCGFDTVRDDAWADRFFCEATVAEPTHLRRVKLETGYRSSFLDQT